MRENEKELELVKSSFLEILFISKRSPVYSDAWDLNTAQSQEKCQNNQKQ